MVMVCGCISDHVETLVTRRIARAVPLRDPKTMLAFYLRLDVETISQRAPRSGWLSPRPDG